MLEKEFYEAAWQYEEKFKKQKLSVKEKIFNRLTLSRHQLAINWLEKISGRLLDVGCSSGVIMFSVHKNFDELVGLDIAENQVKKAQEQAEKLGLKSKIKFICHNLNQPWPVQENFFDVVVCLDTLEHLFDPEFILKQINRALKQGGVLVLTVPNIAYIKHRLRLFFGILPKTSGDSIGWDGGHLHYFTKNSLIKLLEDCGFQIVKVTGCGLLAKLRNWWPSLLTGNLAVKAIKK